MLRGSSSGQRQAPSTSALANIDKNCLRASRDLARGLDKCYKHNQVPAQATANLSQCVEHYEPRLAALSAELQACPAGRDAVEESRKKLDEAFRQISAAKKLKFENNMVKFSGTALAQIIKAVQGGQVEPMVIDACGDSALCAPLAGALQDFTQDLLQLMAHKEASKQEAIQDAVAKTAEERRKAAAQADKEKAEWMEQNSKLQSQLHATNLREIAALRSLSALKQDLCAAKQHASDSAWGVPVLQQLAEQHAADLKVFLHDLEQRVEDADMLQQTLRTQLSAETERALSSEARVIMLDLHLEESRAKVDKLAAQVEDLEEEQGAKHETIKRLTHEGQELKQQVAAQQCTLNRSQVFENELADEKARHLATLQAAAELKREAIAEQQACVSAKENLASLQTDRAAAQQSAASLQTKLAAAEEALAAEKFAHGSAVTSLKADLGVAEQGVSSLQSQLKALESQLAAGKQAFEAVNQDVASFPTPLKATQHQAATEKQAQEAADWSVPSYQTPVQGAQQIVSALRTQLEAVQQELADKAATETVNRAVSSLHADLQAAEQQLSVGLSMQKAHQAGGHTAADLHMQLDWADGNTHCLQEELRSCLSKMSESRDSRPEADDDSQLTAALRQAHPPAAPQEGVALVQEVSKGQAKHGNPTAPLQQETPGRNANTLLDDHGMQQEIQDLQQELQSTKTALQLSKDRLQKQDAAINCLNCEAEASWQQMDGRHEELSQQVNSLKASLRRAGAHDEDAYRHDIQEYKKSPELFDRYGDPVRPAESLKAMWPNSGLPPPTDPRLVKSVIHLSMPPEELAFHVPRYGLVTTANCKQLMLFLEDRHGEAGVDNQDLGLTLLRAAQSVWVAANLIPWARHKADLGHLGISGRPPLSPADQRRWFTVISRESLQDPAPLFNGYLAGMMAELKQGGWRDWDDNTQDKVCFGCGAEWDGDVDDNGKPVGVHLQVVNLHCPTCATYKKDGQLEAGDCALCVPCAQKQAKVGRCVRPGGQTHELPVTRRTPQFFLEDAANAPPEKKCCC